MIVDQFGHLQTVGTFFHVHHEAQSADGIGFEIVHDSVATVKEGYSWPIKQNLI
jgi:ABC-type transport system involved in cytochrome bd biosynthesis fused ATPase/permease subunit